MRGGRSREHWTVGVAWSRDDVGADLNRKQKLFDISAYEYGDLDRYTHLWLKLSFSTQKNTLL